MWYAVGMDHEIVLLSSVTGRDGQRLSIEPPAQVVLRQDGPTAWTALDENSRSLASAESRAGVLDAVGQAYWAATHAAPVVRHSGPHRGARVVTTMTLEEARALVAREEQARASVVAAQERDDARFRAARALAALSLRDQELIHHHWSRSPQGDTGGAAGIQARDMTNATRLALRRYRAHMEAVGIFVGWDEPVIL